MREYLHLLRNTSSQIKIKNGRQDNRWGELVYLVRPEPTLRSTDFHAPENQVFPARFIYKENSTKFCCYQEYKNWYKDNSKKTLLNVPSCKLENLSNLSSSKGAKENGLLH